MLTIACLRAETVELSLKTIREQMRFDLKELHVPVGSRVNLHIFNDDGLPHNVVICLPRELCSPGEPEDNGMEVAQAAWELGAEGDARHWVPKHPRVLLASRMLKDGERQTLSFDAPARPGQYPFVCTLPGHAMLMFGTLHVQVPVAGLQDVNYTMFRCGPHLSFPDFSTFRDNVIARGVLSDGLLDATPADINDHYAMEFTATLEIPQDGDYTFSLAGDKGTQLFIDGTLAVDHRTGHSARAIKVAKLPLKAGPRKLLYRYWHQLGEDPVVSLVWSGPGFEERALSRINLVEQKRQNDGDRLAGMHLAPQNGEPVFYRNYLADLPKGGFAVGFPSGANASWNPDELTLGTLWAGDFLNVTAHRTSRGAGAIKPAGYEAVQPTQGPAFVGARTPSPALIYHLLGYRFTPSRDPIFRYRVGNVEVEETLASRGSPADDTLVLTRSFVLTASTDAAPDLLLRLADRPGLRLSPDGGIVDEKLRIRVEGAVTELRDAKGGRELVARVPFHDQRSHLLVEYRWLATAAKASVHTHPTP